MGRVSMSYRRLLGCLLLTCAGLRADVTATILGNAQDNTGATLTNAKITVTNLDTNLSRSTLTDATGEYRFLSLPVGTYTVQAELSGFQKFVAGNIVLTVDQQRRVEITMQVGSLQQSVEVSAAAVQVETTNTQLGTVIDDKNIVNLPLNGRSYIDLLSIQAGVAPSTTSTAEPGLISVNGQRQESNSFLVNGGDVNEGRRMTAGVVPNLDSVAEFRLITNSFDAEYGRFSGAVMNAITKSGTNGLHGAAFEFLRNSDMDARGFFDPAVTVLKRNQFGYAVGGPALKNRLFWFTDYQGTRERRGTSGSLSQLPSVDQRNGIFSPGDLNGEVSGPYWAQVLTKRLGYAVSANEPYSTPTCATTAACVFPGGKIPASAISPISANLLKNYIPVPNAGATTFNPPSVVNSLRDDKAGQRVDFISKLTGNWYGYYYFDDSTATNPGIYGPQFGNFGT